MSDISPYVNNIYRIIAGLGQNPVMAVPTIPEQALGQAQPVVDPQLATQPSGVKFTPVAGQTTPQPQTVGVPDPTAQSQAVAPTQQVQSPGVTPEVQQPSSLGNQASGGLQQPNSQPYVPWEQRSFGDRIMASLTGNGLQGEDLQQWENNAALASLLSMAGASIGGNDTFGGRLGQGVNNYVQGAIMGQQAKKSEANKKTTLQGASQASTAEEPSSLGVVPMPTKAPTASSYVSPNTQSYGINPTLTQTQSMIDQIKRLGYY